MTKKQKQKSPLGDLGANEVTLGANRKHYSSGNNLNEEAKSLIL